MYNISTQFNFSKKNIIFFSKKNIIKSENLKN